MLLRIGIGLGVTLLAFSSMLANYQHVQGYGWSIIGLVIAGECLKPLLPLAMREHARQEAFLPMAATFLVWLMIVTFSWVNTFGNSLMRHAMEQAKVEAARAGEVRPEHVILKDIAALPPCKAEWQGKGRNAKRIEHCPDGRAERLAALQGEIRKSRELEKSAKLHGGDIPKATAHVDDTAIRDGLIAMVSFFGVKMPREMVFVYVTLLWTALAEIGSALGAVAIPRKK